MIHLPLLFPDHQQGARLEMGKLGPELAPIIDASVVGGSDLTCYATRLYLIVSQIPVSNSTPNN